MCLLKDITTRTFFLSIALYMLCKNRELDAKTALSSEDITAADIAPNPKLTRMFYIITSISATIQVFVYSQPIRIVINAED